MMDEKMKKIYDDAQEGWPMAGEDITGSLSALTRCMEDYITAIQEDAFCYGYTCAVRDMGGRTNAEK